MTICIMFRQCLVLLAVIFSNMGLNGWADRLPIRITDKTKVRTTEGSGENGGGGTVVDSRK